MVAQRVYGHTRQRGKRSKLRCPAAVGARPESSQYGAAGGPAPRVHARVLDARTAHATVAGLTTRASTPVGGGAAVAGVGDEGGGNPGLAKCQSRAR